MTNQIQGEILYAGWEGGSTTPSGWAYTPWMPVGGDLATFGVEVISHQGVDLKWEVQTRTRESSTANDALSGTQTANSAGTFLATNTAAMQELVRYRFCTSASAGTTNFVVFRALPPTWQVDR